MSDRERLKRRKGGLLSGCQRFWRAVRISAKKDTQEECCNQCRELAYMENILLSCGLVEVNLRGVSETFFTHLESTRPIGRFWV